MLRAKLLLVAIVVSGVWPALAKAEQARMSSEDIKTTFSGGAFDGVYADNSPWKETYNSNGSIIYSDRFGPRKGEWSIRNGSFCTYYTDGSGACWYVERVSENCFRFYVSAGQNSDRAATATGWATARPGTCMPPRPVS